MSWHSSSIPSTPEGAQGMKSCSPSTAGSCSEGKCSCPGLQEQENLDGTGRVFLTQVRPRASGMFLGQTKFPAHGHYLLQL
uniref:Uncharacterized protein n=1 Tax=Geospiza parvula TaxID=87175 RepID=A0A8C3Q8N9_GEOPR